MPHAAPQTQPNTPTVTDPPTSTFPEAAQAQQISTSGATSSTKKIGRLGYSYAIKWPWEDNFDDVSAYDTLDSILEGNNFNIGVARERPLILRTDHAASNGGKYIIPTQILT
jgi:hypothetical protein